MLAGNLRTASLERALDGKRHLGHVRTVHAGDSCTERLHDFLRSGKRTAQKGLLSLKLNNRRRQLGHDRNHQARKQA